MQNPEVRKTKEKLIFEINWIENFAFKMYKKILSVSFGIKGRSSEIRNKKMQGWK